MNNGIPCWLRSDNYSASRPMTGDKLVTAIDCHCEAALNRFDLSDELPANTVVVVVQVFANFFGTFIRCEYNGKFYDLKPINLKRNGDQDN